MNVLEPVGNDIGGSAKGHRAKVCQEGMEVFVSMLDVICCCFILESLGNSGSGLHDVPMR